MKLKEFLENQIKDNKISWESKSDLIRASGFKMNGNNAKILKEYQGKFNFSSSLEIKNKEIKKYFNSLKDGSYINMTSAVEIIKARLPKGIEISKTIILNRLNDKEFNKKMLKAQTLDNQVSKTELYDVKISKEFKDNIEAFNHKNLIPAGYYLYLEKTQRGSNTLRLKMTKEVPGSTKDKIKKLIGSKSFPPNKESLKQIKEILNENK